MTAKSMEVLAKMMDLVRQSLKYVVWIFLVSETLLFMPADWLVKVRVAQFVDDWGNIIGPAFVFSGSFALVEVLSRLWSVFQVRYTEHKFSKKIASAISKLDLKEKAVLGLFFIKDQRTLHLPKEHPVVAGLVAEGILEVVDSGKGPSISTGLYHMRAIRISLKISHCLSSDMLGISSNPTLEEQAAWKRKASFLWSKAS